MAGTRSTLQRFAKMPRSPPGTINAFNQSTSQVSLAQTCSVDLKGGNAHTCSQDVDDVGMAVHSAESYASATEKAEGAAQEAKDSGKTTEEQAEAAANAAAESMKDSGAAVKDEITAAYKSAEEAAINAGMDATAAKKEAEKIAEQLAEKEGMSASEAAKLKMLCRFQCIRANIEIYIYIARERERESQRARAARDVSIQAANLHVRECSSYDKQAYCSCPRSSRFEGLQYRTTCKQGLTNPAGL